MSSFNISYKFEALDKFTAISNKISGSISKLTGKLRNFKAKFQEVGRGMSDMGRRMAMSVTAPIIGIAAAIPPSATKLISAG